MLDYNLQVQLRPHMEKLKPRPSIYYPDFIAANQADRADNILPGTDKWQHLEQIRQDIRDFKNASGVEKVIVLWTANTERFCDIREGLNDTAENLLESIRKNESEVSASTVFAVASILEVVLRGWGGGSCSSNRSTSLSTASTVAPNGLEQGVDAHVAGLWLAREVPCNFGELVPGCRAPRARTKRRCQGAVGRPTAKGGECCTA